MKARDLGILGEQLAARHFQSMGFDVVGRNFRCPRGEIDLILRRGRLVVFCEVKTRTSARFGEPAEAVDARKRARLRRLATIWLTNQKPGPVDIRFDVVSAIVRGDGLDLEHIPDAF